MSSVLVLVSCRSRICSQHPPAAEATLQDCAALAWGISSPMQRVSEVWVSACLVASSKAAGKTWNWRIHDPPLGNIDFQENVIYTEDSIQ